MTMINNKKKNGELITCAFNVFHTNFLIKHNCVLIVLSTFLFSLPDHFSPFLSAFFVFHAGVRRL